jgi:NitT/TauT family transport system substrate-binding protein
MPTGKTRAMKPLFTALLSLMLATSLIAIVGCEKKPASTPATTYRIGLGPWVGFGPFYLAKDKGFFDEAGVKVDLIVLTGLAERNSALKSGQIEGLAAPVDYFVLSAGNHLETSIVMAIDESSGGDGIVANKSIQTIQDLRGKRVAFQRGLPSEFFLRALLEQNNIPISSLKTVDMETAQGGAAFISKQVDAAVLWEPWLSKAVQDGKGHILASTSQYHDLIVDVLAFNKSVVSNSPQDVQKIVNALLKAMDYWKQHPDEADKIMAPYFQVDAAKYAAILSGAKFCDLTRNQAYFGSSAAPGPIFDVAKRASGIWQEAKVIEAPVRPDSIATTDFVAAAGK